MGWLLSAFHDQNAWSRPRRHSAWLSWSVTVLGDALLSERFVGVVGLGSGEPVGRVLEEYGLLREMNSMTLGIRLSTSKKTEKRGVLEYRGFGGYNVGGQEHPL